MMTDKQVGELWARLTLNHPNPLSCDRKVESLIRKLVEERRVFKIGNCPFDYCASNHNDEALRDFGIDPLNF